MKNSHRFWSIEGCLKKPLAVALMALIGGCLGVLAPESTAATRAGVRAAAAPREANPGPEYAFIWQVDGHEASLLSGYQAKNPSALWDASITELGLQLRSAEAHDSSAGSWEIDLRLSGYGHAGDLQQPSPANISARENQIVVERDGLTIAYTNGPRGLEQVFTLGRPLAGGLAEADALVSLDLTIAGDIHVRRAPDGSGVELVRPDGETALLYTIAHTYGGGGSGVPARIEVLSGANADSRRLWIVLHKENAIYPLKVELLMHRNIEFEPNDLPARASAVSCGVEGATNLTGDVDYFALGAPAAGSRLFAAVEDARGGAGAFRMRLESTAAVSGTEGHGDAGHAILRSGPRLMTRLLGGGPAFVRVEAVSPSLDGGRYRLYAAVQPPIAFATEETEPNDAPATASRSANDYYAATLASPSDRDHFAFTAAAGDVTFIGLDTDRNRDGKGFAGALALLDASGSLLASAAERPSRDVGLVYRALAGGTYVVKVTGEFPFDAPDHSDYALSISRNCQGSSFAPAAPTEGGQDPATAGGGHGASRTSVPDLTQGSSDPNDGGSREDALFAPPSEVNDSVRVTKTGTLATISWTDSPGPFNVYRGSKGAGQSWAYNQSCFSPKLATTSTTDPQVPARGAMFYYLVTRQFTCEESIAGKNSSGVPIPDNGLCLSPGQGPPPSKPYFMVIVDNSGSMGTAIASGANSCGYQHNRIGDARCAVRNMLNAYAGQVNLGLATYAWKETSCQNATCGTCDGFTGCFPQCVASYTPTDDIACGPLTSEPTIPGFPIHAGANVAVELQQDHYWVDPPSSSNLAGLLTLVDNNCGNTEIGASSNTPLGGVLFGMNQYFSGTFHDPFTSAVLPTPIGPATFNGQPAERPCRSINVILITDGDETCDHYNTAQYPNNEGLAVYEAQRLFTTGVTVSGQNFRIKTYVIGFVGATLAALNNIAIAGGTSNPFLTSNEAQLSQALGTIITGALAPDKCDNLDNNCNGCVDDAFRHFSNVQPVPANCCAWSTTAQRTTCLNSYLSSITPANPQGNRLLLPCTTAAQQLDPTKWLCYNPGERCDGVDNNGDGAIDEGQVKCGSPLHCPTTEVCNGQDDDCDGQIDEGGVCPNGCVVSPEICDGCDNDCDGVADNGIAPTPCGQPFPPNCAGTRSCKPPVAVPVGGCNPGGGYNACTNNPQSETCDGLDNDCNGAVDDSGACPCAQRQELCNGIDDNCNGQTDEGVTPPPVTQVCGVGIGATRPECTTQVAVACVGGAWQCTFPAGVCSGPGGCSGTAEVCDGLDNDCDGQFNENVPSYGKPCASDDGLPAPGDGPCRTTGTFICNGPNATVCSAVKASCATLPGGCEELCDGIDNDCDGLVDEPFTNKGTNAQFFVKPDVTKIASALWIYSDEASRPSANAAFPGTGNGYFTSAPAGTTLDKTKACSVPGKVPWFNVTGTEAEQTCTAVGGHLCTSAELQVACVTKPPGATTCTFGYSPNGAACTTVATASKYCNLGPTFDFSSTQAGDQDGLLVTASPLLRQCQADWTALLGNNATTGEIFDVTGNLREIAKVGTNQYVLLGGAFDSASEAGSTCQFTFYNVNETYLSLDTGFRCCFIADPRQ